MKTVLRILLITFLCLNGILAIISGIKILYHLNYVSWLNNFLMPGVLLFILFGIASILLSLSTNKNPLILIFGALAEGLCLVFAVTNQEEIFHRLNMFFILFGVEGLTLIVTAALLIAIDSDSEFKPL